MIRRRHRRACLRLAVVAMLALLWSQTALAWHLRCPGTPPAAAMAAHAMAMADEGGACAQPAAADGTAGVCAEHCHAGAANHDVARIPALPALPAAIAATIVAVLTPPASAPRQAAAPPPPIHKRPTAHPAALLLI